ncbi:unnamed protein product [Angiostrongylus costaricensis]|uniref:Uncharacterized protein n=1 Tax=Angiostrongylus costaricensis TaxID=334426 RepID=A0A0R3PUQ9_ANGCS|nr:unnamed protein product [Angiostrongylus costaricensis]
MATLFQRTKLERREYSSVDDVLDGEEKPVLDDREKQAICHVAVVAGRRQKQLVSGIRLVHETSTSE